MSQLNRFAVDTNFLLDLALPKDAAHDALATIRERIKSAEIIVPPTTIHELAYLAVDGDDKVKPRATKALQSLVAIWRFIPVEELSELQEAVAVNVAQDLRERDVLPNAEKHDSEILGEAAALGCSILVSSDAHLTHADRVKISLILAAHDAGSVVVCSPSDIVKLFGRRR